MFDDVSYIVICELSLQRIFNIQSSESEVCDLGLSFFSLVSFLSWFIPIWKGFLDTILLNLNLGELCSSCICGTWQKCHIIFHLFNICCHLFVTKYLSANWVVKMQCVWATGNKLVFCLLVCFFFFALQITFMGSHGTKRMHLFQDEMQWYVRKSCA